MRRLLQNQFEGGLPYVNDDFNNILQNEHILSYTGYLDGMNDIPFGSGPTNSGIIMTGCTIVSSDLTSTTFNFTHSLVYIPGTASSGDFYQPHPDYLETTEFVFDSNQVFIVPDDQPIIETRTFRDFLYKSVTETKYFRLQADTPTTPHIKILDGMTTRRYKRIVKYFTTDFGEIRITGTLSKFDTNTGIGFDDMHGFQLCNGVNGSTYDIKGRSLICFQNLDSTTPTDNTGNADTTNYGQTGNKGGGRDDGGTIVPNIVISVNNMHPHNHNMGGPSTNLEHKHTGPSNADGSTYFTGGQQAGYVTGGPPYAFAYNVGSGCACRGSFDARTSFTAPRITGSLIDGTMDHRHTISAQGGGQAHDTRSPYTVLAYYQKIPV